MIALFGKHVRKWLLGLALAVRNRTQSMIDRIEYVEKMKEKEGNGRIAPVAIKPVRSGGPPVHWIRLVERHAPELLYPSASQVFWSNIQGNESSGADIQESPSVAQESASVAEPLKAANAPINDYQTLLSKGPSLSQDSKSQRHRRLRRNEKNEISGSDKLVKNPGMHLKIETTGTARNSFCTTQAGSVDSHRFQTSSAGGEETTPSPNLKPERNEMPDPARPSGVDMREKAVAPVAQAFAASLPSSAARQIEKSRDSVNNKGENIQEDYAKKNQPFRLTCKHRVEFDRPVDGYQPNPWNDTTMTAQQSLISETAYESKLRSGEEQSKTPPANKGTKSENKRSEAPELRWPNLPGEKTPNGAEDPHLTAIWPSLPEEQTVVATCGHRTNTHLSTEKPQQSERLRRLDAEQRGISWSVSHF